MIAIWFLAAMSLLVMMAIYPTMGVTILLMIVLIWTLTEIWKDFHG
jgi:hypothetical protein